MGVLWCFTVHKNTCEKLILLSSSSRREKCFSFTYLRFVICSGHYVVRIPTCHGVGLARLEQLEFL